MIAAQKADSLAGLAEGDVDDPRAAFSRSGGRVGRRRAGRRRPHPLGPADGLGAPEPCPADAPITIGPVWPRGGSLLFHDRDPSSTHDRRQDVLGAEPAEVDVLREEGVDLLGGDHRVQAVPGQGHQGGPGGHQRMPGGFRRPGVSGGRVPSTTTRPRSSPRRPETRRRAGA